VTLLPEPGRHALYGRGDDGSLSMEVELDLAFPALHGTFGEDGTLQGFLELAELPYVGAGVLASSVAMDKGLFKQLMLSHHIPTPAFVVLDTVAMEADMESALDRAEAVAGYPLFVKPANLGSSVGVSKVRSRSDLLEGLMDAAQYDRRLVVERGLEAREIELSVLGNEEPEASMPGEIVPSDEFYSYRAKYIDETSELLIPAPLDPETTEEARRIAVQAYRAIDCAGMARVDLLLDKQDGKLYMNEINTIPGFTTISMYPKLWEASGIPYPELMDRLIELALARGQQTHGLSRRYKGADG
jgi:D-alanine-D-alanine ligase